MMQLTVLFREQPRTVVVLGAEHLPAEPALVDGNRFAGTLVSRRRPTAASRLVVITDQPGSAEQRGAATSSLKAATAARAGAGDSRGAARRPASRRANCSARSGLQVLVVIPPDFGRNLATCGNNWRSTTMGPASDADYPRPKSSTTRPTRSRRSPSTASSTCSKNGKRPFATTG